jgi:hypothetical protein
MSRLIELKESQVEKRLFISLTDDKIKHALPYLTIEIDEQKAKDLLHSLVTGKYIIIKDVDDAVKLEFSDSWITLIDTQEYDPYYNDCFIKEISIELNYDEVEIIQKEIASFIEKI